MKNKELPFKTIFSSVIKPLVSEEKDKYLALASLEEIKAFIPKSAESNIDLLPIAFNACVVNRVNRNNDVIDTKTALSVYKNFINKQINTEHKRTNVIGTILTAGFSEFGTDKPLTEEEVKDKTGPFNITLGGIIWKVVNSEITDFIQESNDPTSKNYMAISASWELGYSDYKLVLLDDGLKNIEDGVIITDEGELNKLKAKLDKGETKTIDNKNIYRLIDKDVIPLGIGLTQRPAGDVEGIATETKGKDEEIEASELNNKKENIISQETNSNVNTERQVNMKINSIKDITDESLKQVSASTITDFISTHLAEKSKEWTDEKNNLSNTLTKASDDYKKLSTDYTNLQGELNTLKATVETLNKEKIEKQKVDDFNIRMGEVSDLYELDDEVRAAIVEEVKALASDEDYVKWKKKASVLLKGFAKVEKCKECGKPHSGKCEAKAQSQSNASQNNVVDDAIDKGQKDKNGLPNTSASSPTSLKDKYQAAFAKDQFIIKY